VKSDRSYGPITASSVGLTVAPAARAEESVAAASTIDSPCGLGRRSNAMTLRPRTATVRAITAGGGILTGFFIFMEGDLIAAVPKGNGPRH
jgi:hypothetical protein